MWDKCHLRCKEMGYSVLHPSQTDGANKKDDEDNVGENSRHLESEMNDVIKL